MRCVRYWYASMRGCEFIACIQITHKTHCTLTSISHMLAHTEKVGEDENHKEYIKWLARCREITARFLYTSLFRPWFHSVCVCMCNVYVSAFSFTLVLNQQYFFIHNAYDTYVFIGHTSIRNDKNDNDLHQLCVCVCIWRRLTKYHLRLKWKTGCQQQLHLAAVTSY